MKKSKSPAKSRRSKSLWESLTEPESRKPLVREAWDFRTVPRDESEPCYLYEYSKESPLIVSKITAALKRRQYSESAAANKRRSAWFKSNPEPTEDRERQIWQAKMVSEIGDTVVKTELEPEIHFLVNFAEKGIFPEKYWLQIDPGCRRKHAVQGDRWRVGHVDPASMEAKQLLIYPLDYFLELKRLFPIAGLSAKLPDHSGPHVFDVCWARSDRKLRKDFEQWLKNNRPKDQPGFLVQGGSQRTTPRDLLKCLAALRLMRAYKRDAVRAADYTWKICGKSLYKEQTTWIKAEKKAEEHFIVFQRKMLRI
jgi:hypothetical protein